MTHLLNKLGEQVFYKLGFRRPSAAKTLAGSSNGDQSGRINSSHSIIEELARSDWMGLSGGDQSGRINTSHSIIEELARFGHFGSFFAILGHFWPFLGHFGSLGVI